MDALIPVINKLQDVFNAVGVDRIDLPQIAVVGAQSSGKSSVLENIVGRDFLPRGTGICTRRPLILQLIHLPTTEGSPEPKEWGEFLHLPNKMIHNFEEIRDEIAQDTERVAGKGTHINPQPINLKIYSPRVLNLTMIDLPGITKVPVGDQPGDIERQVRKMILSYIDKPACLILAVHPATSDLANSDAIKLAREVDPDGTRTLGVITKLDMMGDGEDASDMLSGKIIPLRLGFIGVVNRSQRDIQTNKPIGRALEAESAFFRGHSAYRSSSARLGTAYLAKTLNRLLVAHIRDALPSLRRRIADMIASKENELAKYGDSRFDNKASQSALLLQLLTKFAGDFQGAIDGVSPDICSDVLLGGAKINHIFVKEFGRVLDEMSAVHNLTEADIQAAINNAKGPRPSLFVPEISFELLAKRQITNFEAPAIRCVELVHEELQHLVDHTTEKGELARFPSLRERTGEVANKLLSDCLGPTKQMVRNLMAMELAYINTNHPDFLASSTAYQEVLRQVVPGADRLSPEQHAAAHPEAPTGRGRRRPSNISQGGRPDDSSASHDNSAPDADHAGGGGGGGGASGASSGGGGGGLFSAFFSGRRTVSEDEPSVSQPLHLPGRTYGQASAAPRLEVPSVVKASSGALSDRQRVEGTLIRNLLKSYFGIVRKNMQDLVPKAIMTFLVNQSKDNLQSELVSSLYRDDLMDELLKEADDIAAKRRECLDMLAELRQANAVLAEVREVSV